ncbi:MAG: carboxypeptidase-like regulatory domain-containing protein [Planctomycetota bacterium]
MITAVTTTAGGYTEIKLSRASYWVLVCGAVVGAGYLLWPRTRAVRPMVAGAPSEQAPRVVRQQGEPPVPSAVGVLRGWVIDRLGWPVTGARATLLASAVEGGTAESGAFQLPVPEPRAYRVGVGAPGLEPQIISLHPAMPAAVVLRDALPWTRDVEPSPRSTPPSLSGEGFLRTAAGDVVEGGVVSVVETEDVALTDSAGRYRIGLPGSPATLLAHDATGRVARSEPVYPTRDEGLVPLPDLALAPGRVLRGYVRDPDGEPCDAAFLRVRGQGARRFVRTRADGSFACAGLLPGTYVVEALPHRGALGLRRPVTLDRGVDLELMLVRAQTLEVLVVEEGEAPLAGVHVVAEEGELRRAHGRTDVEGRATLSGVGPGPFAFEVREAIDARPLEIVAFEDADRRLTVRRRE